MAATSPPRRRPAAAPVAVLAAVAVLVVLAAVLVVGRADPGGLKDQGPSQPVTPPLKPQLLWPGLASSPSPSATGSAPATPQASPQPVPDVTASGRDITTVDVRAVLAKDPGVSTDERRALGSCTECEVRSPEFRDLTGDGKPELIAAVVVPRQVVLHVYTLADDRLVPVLRVELLPGFSAETIGTDLWLFDPTSVTVRTTSHYQWDGVRLVRVEQKVEGVGPVPGPSAAPDPVTSVIPPGGRAPGPVRPTAEPAKPTAVPSPIATKAPGRPVPALPGVQP
ncbi:hypothetical protein [Kitasatospora sp. NPDC093558]|uniref:hypothetical protein n=1 Tax=Kitasatospora sp. NPDC093558 TaxID=3155201 RepID=UPI00341DF52E